MVANSRPDASDPADLSAIEARRLIGRGELSAEELARACITRVEAIDPAVNALVARDFDAVIEGARKADRDRAAGNALSLLHGLPVAIKDMNDVAGLATTFGSEIFRGNVPKRDDALVAGLRHAGALPLGKTNNPEWSAGANTRNRVYGTTANPHDLTRNCGGSSGGSAVALACGYAPLASGSDLGGSLRTPAAFCGVVGFRPSFGVVPGGARRTSLLPLATSGPMARNVADCGLMLSIMARPDPRDPFTAVVGGKTAWKPDDFAYLPRCDLAALRFAVTEDFGFAPVEATSRRVFRKGVNALLPFLRSCEETSPDCTDADRIFAVLRSVIFLSTHAAFVDKSPELVGENVTENVREGRSYSAEDVAQALVMQGNYDRRWQRFFDECDFILSPAVTAQPRDWHEAYPREIDGRPTASYYHWLACAYAATIAGCPSITIPCGRDENGMPFGLQIIGRRHDDLRLLAVAAELEALIAGLSELAPKGPDLVALSNAPKLSAAEGFWDVP
ncbi:amidase family protein [Afifella sp. JA880]|uniref:amidase n=1 Tax=Afifella sp. JA880 TaxID=2975280 RepID=UPI0021BB562C|nr:amidase family protein [Afifella sp. JA880]MCT8267624.1 amidase family protein [Afifella sp. JA880]